MKLLFRLLVLAVAIIPTSCVSNSSVRDGEAGGDVVEGDAKYIFYFIGDGMAATQVRLAEAALTAPEFGANYTALTGTTVGEELNLKKLPITGLATANAQDRYITDSAAAGTALATGSKTNVGVISQTPSGERLTTIAEMAKGRGMKVGIVSSVSIDHATPACFYAHSDSRNKYPYISDQLITSGFDYFAGGSPRWDKRAKEEGVDKAAAYDSYRKRAEAEGFKFVTTKAEFDAVRSGESAPVIATLDMLAREQYTGDGSAMPYTIDLARVEGDDNKISLADFTAKGIELLDNNAGFFMMVEGGKIDWACHANDAATAAYEVVAFDEAIGVALDFAAKHPLETLIVVTGDHDCGGLTIGFAGTGYDSAFGLLANSRTSYLEFNKVSQKMIDRGDSFEQLLAFACAEFGFTNDVKDGSDGVITATTELSNFEVSKLKDAYMKSAKRSKFDDADKYRAAYKGYDPFTTTCTHILNNKAGVDYTSYSHTGVPVMVFAQGVNSDIFSGYYDNTDIAKKIMLAGGLK